MANKKQTAEQVKNVLDVGYFENTREVVDNDPIEAISMKLHIEKIQKYDRNPRQSKNPEYNTLLELLRANGQEEALTVTRRPGDEKYIIRRGGNTRLDIMNMLYHETGDQRFEIIDCLFMPWTSESDCIVGHLNENTSQGRMTLIDKARGYRHFKLEYEKEHEIEALGQRKLASLLKDKGSPINTPLLGIMNYALDELEPAIPETLARGLGKPQIEKLKRVNQTFQRLAEAHDLYDPETRDEQIKAEFHKLLSDHDGDEWDLELVLHEFSQRLGGLLNQVAYNRLKFDIDECLKKDPWKVDLMSTIQDEPEPVIEKEKVRESTTFDTVQFPATQPAVPTRSNSREQESKSVQPRNQNDDFQNRENLNTFTNPPSLLPEPPERQIALPDNTFTAGEFDLKSIRARIYILALQFAQSTRIQDCLKNWNAGYGYFLDLPRAKLISARDEEKCSQNYEYRVVSKYLNKDRNEVMRSLAWWMLWQAQGLYDYSTDRLVPGYELMPESQMKEMIALLYSLDYDLESRGSTLMLSASTKIGMHTGDYNSPIDMALAYTYIKPDSMMKYINLLEARTQLQAYVETNNINLWKEV